MIDLVTHLKKMNPNTVPPRNVDDIVQIQSNINMKSCLYQMLLSKQIDKVCFHIMLSYNIEIENSIYYAFHLRMLKIGFLTAVFRFQEKNIKKGVNNVTFYTIV